MAIPMFAPHCSVPSLVVPFFDRIPLLGTWQQVVLVDFDTRPRSRDVICQIMGRVVRAIPVVCSG
ncbi:MAG: hypothetical protein KatS3mg060_2706 [Dehalococcoidia bacterium]|nr:MAG: hypothetical protein KatS3mg060_2706 [Dehalococcoidia bacterium]